MSSLAKEDILQASGVTYEPVPGIVVVSSSSSSASLGQAARAFNSGAIAIASDASATPVLTALTFDSERFDTDSIHDLVTNTGRLTCKTAGKYYITGSIQWAGSSGGSRRMIAIRLNGSTIIAAHAHGGMGTFNVPQSVATIYDLAVGDYLELCVNQDSTASLNINASGNYSPEFGMVRVG